MPEAAAKRVAIQSLAAGTGSWSSELDALIERLRGAKARFRGDISDGGAGRAILLEDPSGNIIELFEFKKR